MAETKYSLTTPDGYTFYFAPGICIDAGIPEGFGLPPIEHSTMTMYRQAGALLTGLQVKPRIVTITASAFGECRKQLHQVRARLWNALRWNRDASYPPPASTLRYTHDGTSVDLKVHYLSDIVNSSGETAETIGIRLVAYDPMFYAIAQTVTALSPQDTLTVSRIVAKLNGAWDNLNGGGTGTVYDIAITPDGDTVYVGGDFLNWEGIANADYMAQYTVSTDTWAALNTGPGAIVRAIVIDAGGDVYVAAGGSVQRWDGWNFSSVGAMNDIVYGLEFDVYGDLYAVGAFTTIGGNPFNYVALYDPSSTVWSGVIGGVDPTFTLYAVDVGTDNLVYVGGDNIGEDYICVWDGAAWATLGAGIDGPVRAIAHDNRGNIYIGGNFTGENGISGVNSTDVIGWNGAAYFAMGTGVQNDVFAIEVAPDGTVYVGARTVTAQPYFFNVSLWDGSAWRNLDLDVTGVSPLVYTFAFDADGNVYIGSNTNGACTGSEITNVARLGTGESYPIFTITGPGTLQYIENVDTGRVMRFSCFLNPGEVATLDLTPGAKTFSSNWRANLMPYSALLPQSDLGLFYLAPDPVAAAGANRIAVYMTGIDPVEINDNAGQLDVWTAVTGVTYANTDSQGTIHVSVIADGGGFFHVNLYRDRARTLLVAHTASFNNNGAKAFVADNGSGLGGSVTVTGAFAADVDIAVFFATVTCRHYNAYLSADEAVD